MAASNQRSAGLGADGRLAPCPRLMPPCVRSESGTCPIRRVRPLAFSGDPAAAMRRLRETLAAAPRTTIVAEADGYLRAVCRSRLWGFRDDIELRLSASERVIHVRSASRVGAADMGVNRRRVERLRESLARAGAQ